MFQKKYIKKIDINSNEWEQFKNIKFDKSFYYDKTTSENGFEKTYRYFFLNSDNRKKLNIKENTITELNYFQLKNYQKRALDYIMVNRRVSLNLPVRFGKSYLAISAILNNKENSILFVDTNMLEKIKNIFEDHGEKNVFIFHNDKNKNIFDEINETSYKIIITTEETFISRFKLETKNPTSLSNKLSLFKNIIIDEFHNFIKIGDKRFKDFSKIIKKFFKNIDLFILLSATPINENPLNIFKAIQLLDNEFIPSDWKKECAKYIKNYHGGGEYEIKDNKFIRGILEEFLYLEKEINPFDFLIIEKIEINQNDEINKKIKNTKNNINKQQIADDYRVVKDCKSFQKESTIPEKNKKAIEIIKQNPGKKIVVISYFKESQKLFIEDLKNNSLIGDYINGDKKRERENIIDKFQKGNLNIISIQKDTAIGITLDAADLAIIICSEYEPQKFYQAIGRIVSTDLNNPVLKKIYWIYDEEFNSNEALNSKIEKISSLGVNYSFTEKENKIIFCESGSDINFIKRFLNGNYKKIKLIPKNELSFNKDFLIDLNTLNLNYVFICDNDQIVNDLKLKENNIKHLTYNKLFNVNDNLDNIEKILNHLGVYNMDKMNLIENCNEKNNSFINIINNLKNEKVIENKIKIIESELRYFLNTFLKCNEDKILIDYICEKIIDRLRKEKIQKPTTFILSVIKTVFMENISDEFIEEYKIEVQQKLIIL